MAPGERASYIMDKLDAVGYDVVTTDKDNIMFAGIMIEKAIDILRQHGDDKDILFLIAKHLTEGKP